MTAADEHTETEETLDLVDEVAAHDEALGDAVAALAHRVEELERTVAEKDEEIETLTERLQRTQADFQNYKKRAKERQSDLEAQAKGELLERFLAVRDDLSRALADDSDDLESLKEGVRVTRNEFDRVLDAEDVKRVDPEPGSAVDPSRHEVMMRVESDQPADTVAGVYRPGYEMDETILRTAQVTVSEGADDESDSTAGGGDSDSTDESQAERSDSAAQDGPDAVDRK